MKYFDAHSHVNFSQYDDDRSEVIRRMGEEGVGTITVGTGVQTSREAIVLAAEHENIWASAGVHPAEANDVDFAVIEKLARESKVIAVGECGLDYFHKPYDKEVQEDLFIKHLDLSQNSELPLIIHCRPSAGTQDAYHDLLSIFIERGLTSISGVMHFFAGTEDEAQSFLDLGMYISFAGPVTFTEEYDRVIEATPLDRLLIETDAPFAAPAPYRGKRNEPAYVMEVAKKIAEVKSVSVEKVAEQTKENAMELFSLEH